MPQRFSVKIKQGILILGSRAIAAVHFSYVLTLPKNVIFKMGQAATINAIPLVCLRMELT